MVVQLKQICRVSTVALSTTVGVKPQTTTFYIINHNRSLQWLLLFLVLGYIAVIQIYFETMGWMVGNKEHVHRQEDRLEDAL